MKNFICWEKANVLKLINPEAEYLEDQVFAAVHQPVVMTKKLTEKNNINPHIENVYEQQDLLKDFLDEDHNHRLVPILGVSGSGKSHMIRWLKAHIPPKEGREIILIPKANTNLREIISNILSNRVGDEFDMYRNRLAKSKDEVSQNAGISLLLDNIAHKIEYLPLDFYKKELPSSQDNPDYIELVEYVKGKIPNILRDNHIRTNYWLVPNGVITRLYNQAVGENNQVEQSDSPTLFSIKDLPLNIEDINNASGSAREFLEELYSVDDFQKVSVQLLNLTLNEAIRELLIGGEDLTKLFLDVRRHLYRENIELIFLIEDFAKMQGIDGALLEALIAQSRPKEPPLCVLRTALACTDGYYGSIPKTVKTRVSYTVHISYDVEKNVNYDAFVANYLNAVRLGEDGLRLSFDEYHQNNVGFSDWKVPNSCSHCQHQTVCHKGFGAYDGVGLYPFNSHATKRLYNSVMEGRNFNPREFIGKFLQVVMHQYAPGIAEGEFPTQQLLNQFGGTTIPVIERTALKNEHGKLVDKILPLVEFWSGKGSLESLHPNIYEAFDLKLAGVDEYIEEEGPAEDEQDRKDDTVTSLSEPEELPKTYKELDRWSKKNPIAQVENNKIQSELYDAIIGYINWEEFGIISSEYTTNKPYFKKDDILFLKEVEEKEYPGITLALPFSEEERDASAQALQGLMLYKHYGNWNFDKDRAYFLAFAKYLQKWSQHVLDQMLTHSEEKSNWDPIKNVVQWLYLGGRMSGNIKADSSLVDTWAGMLSQETNLQLTEERSTGWKKVYKKIIDNKEHLLEKLYHYTLCPKGKSKRLKVFDVVKVIPLLEEAIKNANQLVELPKDYSARFSFLDGLKSTYENHIDNALSAEAEYYKSWKNGIQQALGTPEDFKETTLQLKSTFEEIKNNGYEYLIQGEDYQKIKAFLGESFLKSLSNAYLNANHVESLFTEVDEKSFGALLSRLGRTDVIGIMRESSEFVKIASDKLLAVERRIDKEVEQYQDATWAELNRAQETINTSLNNLITFVEEK